MGARGARCGDATAPLPRAEWDPAPIARGLRPHPARAPNVRTRAKRERGDEGRGIARTVGLHYPRPAVHGARIRRPHGHVVEHAEAVGRVVAPDRVVLRPTVGGGSQRPRNAEQSVPAEPRTSLGTAPKGPAWCPGGRTTQNALGAAPVTTASTAAITAPQPYTAASKERALSVVSASRLCVGTPEGGSWGRGRAGGGGDSAVGCRGRVSPCSRRTVFRAYERAPRHGGTGHGIRLPLSGGAGEG